MATIHAITQGRSAGRLESLLLAAHALSYVERASAYAVAGWLPKIASIETKLRLGRLCHGFAQRAADLERWIGSRTKMSGPRSFPVPQGWQTVMHMLDAASTAGEFLDGLYRVIAPVQTTAYTDLLAQCDPCLDEQLIALIEPMRAAIERAMAPSRTRVAPAAATPFVRRMQQAWDARDTQACVDPSNRLWTVAERVLSPARPPGLERKVRGVVDSTGHVDQNPAHICQLLLRHCDEQITAMELFGRCAYEHPDMPASFHLAMAAQVSDEARHAAACIAMCERLGARYGDGGISTSSYDLHYQFSPCEPGTKRELLWRLLLRSTIQQALAVDGLPIQIRRRENAGQDDIARIFESILADEVFHVQTAVRWSRYLCDGSDERMVREREEAHRFYVRHFDNVRHAVVEEPPESGCAEKKSIEEPAEERTSHSSASQAKSNGVARRAAGMTYRDCELGFALSYAAS